MALPRSTIASVLLVAGLGLSVAQAQVSKVAFNTDDDDPFGANNTDAGVSVNDQAVVSTSNMRLSLFNRSGTLLNTRQVGGTNPNPWPFARVDTVVDPTFGPSRFFDPQTVYYPQSGQLFVIYSEENRASGSITNDISPIHMAVSKDMVGSNVLDTFDAEDWWYYTGTSGSRPFFNMQATMTKYRDDDPEKHKSFSDDDAYGLLDKPHMAVDEQAVYITMNGRDEREVPGGTEAFSFNAIAIIPTSHGTGGSLSILDGDKPQPGDITFLRNIDLPVEDPHERHYTVQEPFEQYENAQFILSLKASGETPGDPADSIRLAGLWFNTAPVEDRWEYSQRVKVKDGTTDVLEHDPMPVGSGFEFMGGNYRAITPDPGSVSPPRDPFSVRVAAATSYFPSAILVKINNNDWRIFAVHHVRPMDSQTTEAEDQWVIQWYVIDPDIDDFRSVDALGETPSTAWKPTVETTGRLDTAGDRYHPVIGVTQQGVAYIEYTYSSNTVWPEVRRVTLNSSYDDIVSGSETTVKPGPSNYYEGAADGWADFADMQADPVTGCAFWSTHTLVHAADTGVHDKRDVWLFQSLFNCGNSNLNFDGGTDLLDMAMFTDLYTAGARRVDMNVDGTTDAADAAIYADEYDKATGP